MLKHGYKKELLEILKIEYEQACKDWRHRDSMLWGTLALPITLSSGVLYIVFSKEFDLDTTLFKIIALVFAAIFNLVSLTKIKKDRHYQNGTKEYLSRLSQRICGMKHFQLMPFIYEDLCRVCSFKSENKGECNANPRHHNCDDQKLKKSSAFKCLCYLHYILIGIISLALLYVCIKFWYLKLWVFWKECG